MKVQNCIYLTDKTAHRLGKIAKEQKIKISHIAEYCIKNFCEVIEDKIYRYDLKTIIENEINNESNNVVS